ncbi:MAG TPA: imidazoleglycerol-phosphate dehydratase, partial [Acidobacteriota bacterium]|nr:imidazoleglycerol-phosphate dehydratase [Acidobacteriota bacterium]
MSARRTTLERETNETRIRISLDLDGEGNARIETGVGFLDHMLELLARHSGLDLEVRASGDLHVDEHHVVEDVGIVLGKALAEALGAKTGIERYGWAIIPMDEVLVAVALDLGGRFAFVSDYGP